MFWIVNPLGIVKPNGDCGTYTCSVNQSCGAKTCNANCSSQCAAYCPTYNTCYRI